METALLIVAILIALSTLFIMWRIDLLKIEVQAFHNHIGRVLHQQQDKPSHFVIDEVHDIDRKDLENKMKAGLTKTPFKDCNLLIKPIGAVPENTI